MARVSRVLVSAAVALMLAATGAGAAPPAQIEDPCGDSGVNVRVDGEEQVPQDPYSVHWDIMRGSFATAWSRDEVPQVLGVDVQLQLCDVVEMPVTKDQWYSVTWVSAPECGDRLWLRGARPDDDAEPGTALAEYQRLCDGELVGATTEFSELLTIGEQLVIDGNTMTFRLRYADLGPEADAGIAPDRLIHSPLALSSGVVAASSQIAVAVENHGVAAAPISDWAESQDDFRIGSDRPQQG